MTFRGRYYGILITGHTSSGGPNSRLGAGLGGRAYRIPPLLGGLGSVCEPRRKKSRLEEKETYFTRRHVFVENDRAFIEPNTQTDNPQGQGLKVSSTMARFKLKRFTRRSLWKSAQIKKELLLVISGLCLIVGINNGSTS